MRGPATQCLLRPATVLSVFCLAFAVVLPVVGQLVEEPPESELLRAEAVDSTPAASTEPADTNSELAPIVSADEMENESPPASEPDPVDEQVEPANAADTADEPVAEIDEPVEQFEPTPEAQTTAKKDEPYRGPLSHEPMAETDAKSAIFNHAEVGRTTEAQLREKWGDPLAEADEDGLTVLTYRVDPFPRVDVTIEQDKVLSILVHFGDTLPADAVAQQLGLQDFEPVAIPDETGQILGQAYPERGVLFSFSADPAVEGVTQLLLEEIQPLPFALRAEYDRQHRYGRSLKDIDYALRLAPNDAHAHWVKARLLAEIGRPLEALDSAAMAVRRSPDTPRFRTLYAQLLGATDQFDRAIEQIEKVRNAEQVDGDVQARAEYLMGEFLLHGPQRDAKQAILHHQQAIRLALPHAENEYWEIRRGAQAVLLDAHLAVAEDVAQGSFKRQTEVVPKWIDRASQLLNRAIETGEGDPTKWLTIHRRALAAYAALRGELDATEITQQALQQAEQLIAVAEDPAEKRRLEWELAEMLYHVVQIERDRGKHAAALEHVGDAIQLVERGLPYRQATAADQYLVGQLYFLVGSLHAVQRQDHAQAVAWYDKAQPLLTKPLPSFAANEQGLHGERLVSMGVSYWEVERHALSIELTEQGLKLMQQAVDQGTLDKAALAIPLGNLATMHQLDGQQQKADSYAELAAELEEPAAETAQREPAPKQRK